MARTTGPPGVSVASKLFAVLDCFSADHAALTLTDVARRTDLPVSTTRRLLEELTTWGGLERLHDGRYRIGIRLWEVGSLAPRQRGLRDAAFPYMQDLYEAAKENVQLAVPEETEAICIERVFGKRALATETDVGERMPLHATAAGKAILAFSALSIDELVGVDKDELPRYTKHTLVEPRRLTNALDHVRRTGIAYSREERRLGAVGVAAPIIDEHARSVGAIAIVASAGTRLDRLAPAVRTAALSLSRLLR